MKAYTYVKPGLASFVDVDKPVIRKPTDAIVRIVKTTICGTDLHIIKGDVPTCQSGCSYLPKWYHSWPRRDWDC